MSTPVKVFTTHNYRLIESDVKAALFYHDCTIELVQYRNPTNEVVVVVDRFKKSPVAGVWKVIKQNRPGWLGHNGYTFERVNSTGNTLQLWDIRQKEPNAKV